MRLYRALVAAAYALAARLDDWLGPRWRGP